MNLDFNPFDSIKNSCFIALKLAIFWETVQYFKKYALQIYFQIKY